MQNHNFKCRQAKLSDNVSAIAKYLHLTDPYIYPKICKDPLDKSWTDLVFNCMKTEHNVFNIQHLSVVLHEDKIVGIMCVIPCGKSLNFSDRLGDSISKDLLNNLCPVIDGYFTPLISESFEYTGHNVTNVCIDSEYRGNGLGALLLSHCVETYGTDLIHLDVIASNTPAIKLYKRFGFEITNEYYGYSGDDTKLLCYHMIRHPNK